MLIQNNINRTLEGNTIDREDDKQINIASKKIPTYIDTHKLISYFYM